MSESTWSWGNGPARWWHRHDNRGKIEQQKRADPVLSRVWQLASRPELRYILGQSKSTFQMRDILAQNKILLINLKGVSRETASLMGTLLMNAIWHATKNVTKDKPTYLLLDEFADFMDLPIDTESMLAQARKHGLGMVLANQHLSQLSTSMRDAIITNARNKIMFQGNADDGSTLARHMANKINSGDIVNLRTYEAIASIQTPAGNSGPVSINTRPPGRVTGVSAQVRAHSQKTYGRPVNDVYQEMVKRFEQPEKRNKRPRPKVSGID